MCNAYMGVREAAAYLGLSPHTLDNWRSLDRGPDYYRVGGRVVYSKADLETFMAARHVTHGK